MKNLPVLPIIFFFFIPFISGCGLFYQYPEESSDYSYGQQETDNESYLVSDVIDGDTIILSNGDHIRLLGINTSEEGMYFFEESKEVLEIMVKGKQIILETDYSDRDIYGRKLRYVFQENIFVNLEMVKRGFANIYTCPPDVKYTEAFLKAERYARKNNIGLWESSDLDNISIKIKYDAAGNDNDNVNGEYIIFENTGDISLDTYGWTVKDSGTNIYKFDRNEFLPGSKIILFSGKGKDTKGLLYWNSSKPIWNNDFDTLYLRDKKGLLIGIYSY